MQFIKKPNIYFQAKNKAQEISLTNLGGDLSLSNLTFQQKLTSDPLIQPHQQNDIKIKEEYDSFFYEIQSQLIDFSIQKINSEKEKLDFHNIKILSQNDGYMKLLIRKSTNYVQFKSEKHAGTHCIYDVIIGRFFLTISVLNLHRPSGQQYIHIQKQNVGSYGVVRQVSLSQKKIAVKKIRYQKNNFEQITSKNPLDQNDQAVKKKIQAAIREYCLYKIFSMLEIGPKVIFNGIYDIICYNDCVQFYMELCQTSNKVTQKTYNKDLKVCLRKLHSLKFIHKDIKFQNIVYSQELKKYVFIDFGYTHIVEENVWQKTQTSFQGTIGWTSKQMEQLKKNKGKVNLYTNDIYALKKTIERLDNETYQKQDFMNSFDQCESLSQDPQNWSSEDYGSQNIREEQQQSAHRYSNFTYNSQGSTRLSVGNAFEDNPTGINFYAMKSLYVILMKNDLEKIKKQDKYTLIKQTVQQICKGEKNKNLTITVKNFLDEIFQDDLDMSRLLLQNRIRIYGYSQQLGFYLEEFLNQNEQNKKNESICQLLKKINNQRPIEKAEELKRRQQQILIHKKLQNNSCLVNCLKKFFKQYDLTNSDLKENYQKLILDTFIYLNSLECIPINTRQEMEQKIRNIVQSKMNKLQKYRQYALMDGIKKRLYEKKWINTRLIRMLGEIFYRLNKSEVTIEFLKDLQKKEEINDNQIDISNQIQLNYTFYRLYFLVKKFKQAEERVIKYLNLIQQSQQHKKSKLLYIAKDHLGRILIQKKQYQQAQKIFDQSYQNKRQILFPQKTGKDIATYHFYKGTINSHIKNYDKSILQFEQCLDKIIDKNTTQKLIYQTYRNLAHVFQEIKNYYKVIQIMQYVVEISRKINFVNTEVLINDLQNLFFYKLYLRKLQKSQIKEYISELIKLKLQIKQYKIKLFRTQYLPLFHVEQWKKRLQANDENQVNIGLSVMVDKIQPLLPQFKRFYLDLCKSLIGYYQNMEKKQKIFIYTWKYFINCPKSNLQQNIYKNLIIYIENLTKRGHSRKARYLLKEYVYLIPDEYKNERKRAFELSYEINSDLNTNQSQFYSLIWSQKAYLNNECYNKCLNTIEKKIKCPIKRLIMKKKLKKVKYFQKSEQYSSILRLKQRNRIFDQNKKIQMRKAQIKQKQEKNYKYIMQKLRTAKIIF